MKPKANTSDCCQSKNDSAEKSSSLDKSNSNKAGSNSAASRKLLGITVVVVLAALLVLTVISLGKQSSTTGLATAQISANTQTSTGMSSEGFSSYEKMMKAHHPGQAAQATQARTDGFSSQEEMMKAHHGSSSGTSSSTPGVGGCGAESSAASHDAPPQGSGEMSAYGVTYDAAGYDKLLLDAKQIKMTPAIEKLIVGINIELSCCGVKTLQASGNCECGHHVAMFGLAKRLAAQGYTKEQIQSEEDTWKKVFFPEGGGSTGGC